jgi:NAD(P)-dependent dehydrogenase (short-subunit alcohol dehydrogenase family)
MSVLSESVVAITGASRGLGAALARAFDREGARLILGARSERAFTPFSRERIDPARDFMSADEIAEIVVDVAKKSDRIVMPEVVCLPLLD